MPPEAIVSEPLPLRKALPLPVGCSTRVPSSVTTPLRARVELPPEDSLVTVWPTGTVPDRVTSPVSTNAPVPALSTSAPPVIPSGLPVSVPPDSVNVPPPWE